uniref:Uncharacterized protein n=1 Tax=Anguilla anguilla TaxID=7936 RepID=A0A0E9SY72_ANGAN
MLTLNPCSCTWVTLNVNLMQVSSADHYSITSITAFLCISDKNFM